MVEDIVERRRYKRAYFSNRDSITTNLKLSILDEDVLSADIKDLGEYGVGLTIVKDQGEIIKPGLKLTIQKIEGSEQLEFITGLEMEVRWLVNNDRLQHIGFGCEFINIPRGIREKIGKFVKEWIVEL